MRVAVSPWSVTNLVIDRPVRLVGRILVQLSLTKSSYNSGTTSVSGVHEDFEKTFALRDGRIAIADRKL